MKRIALLLISACLFLSLANAQPTGSFETTITFNGSQHTLAYFVPPNYNGANSYPLIVGLHGCGGIATAFRSSMIAISVNFDAIILCPDFLGGQISGSDGLIIPYSIDTTINIYGYNIDTSAVYLTGFSCNGQETFKQGWNEVYPFRGIIPFNAWIPSITPDYNFNSKIPTCICTGDQDGSYQNNIDLYDSLMAHNGTGKLNPLPGIGHIWYYAGRDAELTKCINWIDSVSGNTTGLVDLNNQNVNFKVFPNPVNDNLKIEFLNKKIEEVDIVIYNLKGEIVFQKKYSESSMFSINTSEFSNGMYCIQIRTERGIIGKEKVVILR